MRTRRRLMGLGLVLCSAFLLTACAGSTQDLKAFIASANTTQLRALTGYLADRRVGTAELSTLARHADAGVRSSAIIALAQNEDPAAASAIQEALSDTVAAVRQHAAFAAGQVGGTWAVEALLFRLQTEKHPRVRVALWVALGRVGNARALPAMNQAVGYDRQPALEAMAHVLKREERPAWLEKTLLDALDDSNAPIRATAFYAMHRSKDVPPKWLRERAARSLNASDGRERDAAVRVLRKGVADVEQAVGLLLQNQGLVAHQRAALVHGLSKTSGDTATSVLVRTARAEAIRLIQAKTLVHSAYHPFIAAINALLGRPLAPADRQELKGLKRAMSERVTTPSIASRRRINRMKCAINVLSGSVENCTDLEQVETMGAAGKRADLSAIRSFSAHPSPAVRMAHLHALGVATDDVRSDLMTALEDDDLPVVATAADLARKKSIAGPEMQERLDKAWPRVRDGGNVEVLLDVLRSMEALDTPGLMGALEWARRDSRLVVGRLAVQLIEKRTGEKASLPARSVHPFNVEGVSTYRRGTGVNTARVVTDVGTFTMRLRTDWAPQTVRRFVDLSQTSFFSGVSFHRVVPYFVIQGGDPRGDGWGGPPTTIRCENNPIPYTRGTVGMALAGKDTGSSQWFVTHSNQPHLFGRYTVFGQVVSGQDVVDKIVVGDTIRRVELSRRDWSGQP